MVPPAARLLASMREHVPSVSFSQIRRCAGPVNRGQGLSYLRSRRRRHFAVVILLGVVASLAAGSYWGRAKEAYFDHVFATSYGGKVRAGTWTDPLDRGLGTLDATSREFVARSETDKAIIACTKRWAGWIIEDAPPRDDRSPCALRVTVGGRMCDRSATTSRSITRDAFDRCMPTACQADPRSA